MRTALRERWIEYLIEALSLGTFLLSANAFAVLLEHPASPVRAALHDPSLRRFLMGIAMGLTAVAIIYSPWGKRSGAHLNPSVTLAFFRLGKVRGWDALFYALSQAAGGIAGALLAAAVLRDWVSDPAVGFVATVPGARGAGVAFLAEAAISFGLMLAVLFVSNVPRWSRYTGLCAGALIAAYITLEAPLSGTSMNPARTLASAIPSGRWEGVWIYFAAPTLGMLAAAEVYRRLRENAPARCAKLQHDNSGRCIFCCAGTPACE